MPVLNRISVLAICCILQGYCQAADPAAYIRQAADGSHYLAIYSDDHLKPKADNVVAAVFQNNRLLSSTIFEADDFGADFTIPLPKHTALAGDYPDITVAITASQGRGFLATASTEVTARLALQNPNCYPSLSIVAEAAEGLPTTKYANSRLDGLKPLLASEVPEVQIEIFDERGAHKEVVTTQNLRAGQGAISTCLKPGKWLPASTFDLLIRYRESDPIEISKPMLRTDVDGKPFGNAPTQLAGGDVTQRAIEQNLDMGIQFASSVGQTTSGGIITRRRENVGTLDLRFAPVLDLLHSGPLRRGGKLFTFWTPFAVNANISTQKITDDTLSTNRIAFSSEFEVRDYQTLTTYPTFQRWILSAVNYADRDFHESELATKLKYAPSISLLNRPLASKLGVESHILDPDPRREAKLIPDKFGFGYSLIPFLAGEVGKRYHKHSPNAAFEATDFIRRFSFGADLSIEVTSYVSLHLTDSFFVRGEHPSDRTHNYFKAALLAPLGGPFKGSAHSLFLLFERGNLPPFATPNVNAVSVGYRFQADGWFKRYR
jgi:hypothetical protein